MARVASDRLQSLSRRGEQDLVDDALVPKGQLSHRLGDSEYNVEVLDREQLLSSGLEPGGGSVGKARRAVTVPTRVVNMVDDTAGFAFVDVPAELAGAASGEVAEHALLGRR
jgi:hypothetical protein